MRLALQKPDELISISREPFKLCDDLVIRRHDRVKRQRHGAKPLLLCPLKTLIRLAFAVGKEPYTDKLVQLIANSLLWKHICFHPPTVSAGIARKIDKNALVFGL